jgi:hypothetical protein
MQAIRGCRTALHAHNHQGETLLHILCNPDTYGYTYRYWKRALPVFVDQRPVQCSVTRYRNRARGVMGEILALLVRKGADLHAPDAAGHVPLIMLGKCVWRNLLTVGVLKALLLGGDKRGRRPIDWNATDAGGNTALHWAFSTHQASHKAIRRRGPPIQTLVRTLGQDGVVQKKVLSQLDLLLLDAKGRTLLRLMATHCLQPRSMREHQRTITTTAAATRHSSRSAFRTVPMQPTDCMPRGCSPVLQ